MDIQTGLQTRTILFSYNIKKKKGKENHPYRGSKVEEKHKLLLIGDFFILLLHVYVPCRFLRLLSQTETT